jgi:hypothetical protein
MEKFLLAGEAGRIAGCSAQNAPGHGRARCREKIATPMKSTTAVSCGVSSSSSKAGYVSLMTG